MVFRSAGLTQFFLQVAFMNVPKRLTFLPFLCEEKKSWIGNSIEDLASLVPWEKLSDMMSVTSVGAEAPEKAASTQLQLVVPCAAIGRTCSQRQAFFFIEPERL